MRQQSPVTFFGNGSVRLRNKLSPEELERVGRKEIEIIIIRLSTIVKQLLRKY